MKKLLTSLFIVFSVFLLSPQLSIAATPAPATTAAESTSESQQSAEGTEHAEEKADDSIVGMFGINWKLFIAQLINFGIVLFVLWKWVWKPVTSNMEARTKKIEDSLLNADQINKDKEEFEQWRNTEMTKARTEATEIISTAKQQAEKVKAEILESAKTEQAAVIDRAQQELTQQKVKMLEEAQGELANLVIAASEKLIRSKLDSKSDQKLINQALKDL